MQCGNGNRGYSYSMTQHLGSMLIKHHSRHISPHFRNFPQFPAYRKQRGRMRCASQTRKGRAMTRMERAATYKTFVADKQYTYAAPNLLRFSSVVPCSERLRLKRPEHDNTDQREVDEKKQKKESSGHTIHILKVVHTPATF